MSQLRRCCVVGCDGTNKTHRLFKFPRNDKLRELWLSFLIPVNVMLSGLSKEQLLGRYVCHKHFDRHQFDGTGNRLAHGYPCLFTPQEILYGVPLRSISDNGLTDHNYSQQPTDFDTEEINSVTGEAVGKTMATTLESVELINNLFDKCFHITLEVQR
ncbi:hypothetical protein PYW08_004033 [Mythimna loreyi]|uniref:Uncharacterized protein n=1 Tax=Mythimna loreyi TaxID=667449 RepID=A0ACC2QUA4_9NEOP|nr:hypothetical protein PYW08_004033 [Mythimna loreyi]